MMFTSKNILKKAFMNTCQQSGFKKSNFALKNINDLLSYSSILISRNRSFFSTDNKDENQVSIDIKQSQKLYKKVAKISRRQREQEKEQSDDSDNEGDIKLQKSRDNNNLEDEINEMNQQNPNSLKNSRGHSAYDSNDSLENLVQFDAAQDENFQNTQKLIDRIMKGEVEFNEGDSIDKLVSLDDVFKTRERRLSFQLMNLEDPLLIFQFYDQEVKRINEREGQEDPLTMDEVGLFFYFATFQKKFMSDNTTFQKILVKLVENSKDLSADSLQTFVWALGSYMYEFGKIEFSDQSKKILSDSLLQKCSHFEYAQNPSLCFAISQIFSNENDHALSEPIIEILAETSSKYIETLTHDELVTMIMTFMTIGFSNNTILSKYVERLVQVKEELSEEQIQKAISALGELNYGNSKQFASLTKEILDRDLGNSEPEMNADTACSLIFSLSGAQEKNEELLRRLLRIVHSKYKEMNITSYVNVWLALARFRVDPLKYEQTFAILHKILSQGHVFQMKDLNNDELVRIIVAASSLKLNNKPLVGDIFGVVQLKLRQFKPDQLVLLTRATVIYVKQFESFFIAVHGECLAKLDKFSPEQKSILKQTFNRTRILFPNSPLIETRI